MRDDLSNAVKRRRTSRRKGLVLVAVLWAAVLLMVIVASTGRDSRLDTKISFSGINQIRCKWACRAAVTTAVAVLNEDIGPSDSLIDIWSENDEDFNNVTLEQCRFDVRVVDEAGKLNVNTATREQLLGLDYMTEDVADAIIDWRDSDDTPGTQGVEGGYYENLDFRYSIRNAPFRTVRELLLVRGVTLELLYGEDTNFNGMLDYNERDGDESWPMDDGDDELDGGWIDCLTCYSYDKNEDAEGGTRTNINDADQSELERALSIPGPVARWIVDNRSSSQYESISDLISSSSPKQAASSASGGSEQAQPIDMETFYAIADKITVSSEDRVLGKVNINTAPSQVIRALLGGDERAEQLATDVLKYREGLTEGMASIADLLQAGVLDIDSFKRIAGNLTTRSNVFTVYSFASSTSGAGPGPKMASEVVVDRSATPVQVLYSYQGAGN